MLTKKNVGKTVKNIVLWGLLGLAGAFGASLAGAAIAMKTADPLKAVTPVVLICVGLGALLAAFGAGKTEKGLAAGFSAGGFYVLFLLFASLWGEKGTVSPYLLLGCAVAGTAAGALIAKGKKPNTAKRMKQLTAGKALR